MGRRRAIAVGFKLLQDTWDRGLAELLALVTIMNKRLCKKCDRLKFMESYEVSKKPEGIEVGVCEQCRMMVWVLDRGVDVILVEPKVVMVLATSGEFMQGFIPHSDSCVPLNE